MCNFVREKNGVKCGKLLETGTNYCVIHNNILNSASHSNKVICHKNKKRIIMYSDSDSDNDNDNVYISKRDNVEKRLEDLTRRCADLSLLEERLNIKEDLIDKLIRKKCLSLYYYEKKDDVVFLKSVLNDYNKDRIEKVSNIPFGYLHKQTNMLYENLSEEEKLKYYDKAVKFLRK